MKKGSYQGRTKEKLAKLLDRPDFDQNNLGPMTLTPHCLLKIKQEFSSGREQGSSIISNIESQLEQA